jgi:aerobic carbon-monoxide dehydrogenase large subunit
MTSSEGGFSSRTVGASILPVEDSRLLMGRGNYLNDVMPPGALAVAFVPSAHAHARLIRVDASRARAYPGVHAVLTSAELGDAVGPIRVEYDSITAPNHRSCDWFVLARDKVRFVGESIAVVVAKDRYVAEDAVSLVQADYEPLETVHDAEKGLEPGAPLLHPNWVDNCMHSLKLDAGNVEPAFQHADCVVSGSFTTARQLALPMETLGCAAIYESTSDSLTVWSSTQVPHVLRSAIAQKLGIPENHVRVIAPDIGGGFALKIYIHPQELVVAYLARHLGKPVKWIQDRRENLTSGLQSRQQVIRGSLALSKEGIILGLKANILSDAGAYSAFPWGSSFEGLHAAFCMPGPYKVPAYGLEVRIAVTNKPPNGVYRGVGLPHAVMVMERLLDLGAQKLGIDPAELRLRNLIRRQDQPYTTVVGEQIESGSHQECLQKAMEMVGYQEFRAEQLRLREQGRYIGIGISNFIYDSAPNSQALLAAGMNVSSYDSATIRIDATGKATILISTKPSGQRHETIFAQVAAQELGISVSDIKVVHGDTLVVPIGSGTWGDRGAVTGSGAVILAARKIREKLLRVAAQLTEVPNEDLELAQGMVTRKSNGSDLLSIAEIAKRLINAPGRLPPGIEPGLEMTAQYDPIVPSTHPNGTHLVTLEVDIETGKIKLLRYIAVEDSGTIINPLMVKGQIEGGVAQGIGSSLYEEILYDTDNKSLTGSLMDYITPTGADLTEIEIANFESPSPHTLGGFKGIGVGCSSAPLGAIANAVADALYPLGVEVNEVPLTPERVSNLIEKRRIAGTSA